MKARRRLEVVVISCAAAFAVVLAVSFRPGRRPGSGSEQNKVPPAAAASGQATTLLEGFDFTESVSGKPLMRIKADRTVGYGPAAGLAPNLYAGEKVELTLYPEDGAPVTVYSERADYDERTRESRLSGNVRWTDGEGALAETDRVVFRPKTRALEAPGSVRFTQGATTLTARSARYDLTERVVRFGGPIEGSGNGARGGLSKLVAHHGLYRRDSGVVELEFVDVESSNRDRLAADRLVLQTASDGGHPTSARAIGNVRGVLAAGTGPSAAATSASPPAGERQYAGEQGTLLFDADGRTKSVVLEGSPAMLAEPGRRLTANRIEVGFQDGRAATAGAAGQVRLDSSNGRAEAKQGTLGFAPDGAAENVVLQGQVHLETDGRGGQADRAVEISPRGIWLLTGEKGRAANVQSGGSKLSADRIEIDRGAQTVLGEGRARALFSPDAQEKVRPTGLPGDPKKPTFAKAGRIVLEDARRLATLSGGASLWQEDSSLFADDITLSDADRTLTAVGHVRAVMAPAPARAGGGDKRPAAVITSRRLRYRDSDRSARFEGGVAVDRGGWRASGGDATAWLAEDGSAESVEISGDVKMSDRSTGRSGQAEKALDSPKLGKTVLWGDPARVTDASGNQVAGAILTMVDHGRSVEITAPEGGKTETIHRTQKD